jgi:hypothetical protein
MVGQFPAQDVIDLADDVLRQDIEASVGIGRNLEANFQGEYREVFHSW